MTTVSEFELGKFQGEVEARLTGHDKGIEELANGLAEVSVTCTDISSCWRNKMGSGPSLRREEPGAGGARALRRPVAEGCFRNPWGTQGMFSRRSNGSESHIRQFGLRLKRLGLKISPGPYLSRHHRASSRTSRARLE